MSAKRPRSAQPPNPIKRSFPAGVLHAIPVAVVVLAGVVAIALGSGGGARSGNHVAFLSAVLAENTLALLARRRHPTIALAGVLATYALFDNPATMVLPVVVALFSFATCRDRRSVAYAAAATALVFVAVPAVHRDTVSPLLQVLVPLAAATVAVAIGISRHQRALQPADVE